MRVLGEVQAVGRSFNATARGADLDESVPAATGACAGKPCKARGCGTIQHYVATCCAVLQRGVATCCSVLQHAVLCCNVAHSVAKCRRAPCSAQTSSGVATARTSRAGLCEGCRAREGEGHSRYGFPLPTQFFRSSLTLSLLCCQRETIKCASDAHSTAVQRSARHEGADNAGQAGGGTEDGRATSSRT